MKAEPGESDKQKKGYMSMSRIDEILDFAIVEEQQAYEFYMNLAQKMEVEAMRQVFEEFAREEQGHKARLEAMKAGTVEIASSTTGDVPDMKIADYMVDVQPAADMDYRDALVLAMKKEKAAFRLYSDLAASVADAAQREVFLTLAREEAKHKLRFEIEYDQVVLTQN